MPYLARLTHSADIFHIAPVVAKTELGGRKVAYPQAADQVGVDCQLVEGWPKGVQETFGFDLVADGVAHFAAGTVIRPDKDTEKGSPDKIVLTESQPYWEQFPNLPTGFSYTATITTPSGSVDLTWDDSNTRWINVAADVIVSIADPGGGDRWLLTDNQDVPFLLHFLTDDLTTEPFDLGTWPVDYSPDVWNAPPGRITSWQAVGTTDNKTFGRGIKVAVRGCRG